MKPNPLILTLSLNQEAEDFFTELRNRHFPPERNFLKAHLTLFHHLPQDEPIITEALAEACLNQNEIKLEIVSPISIGNGVAYKIESEELHKLHQSLQQKFHHLLTPQDRQKLRPHITIQNKVQSAVAQQLLASIKESFSPFRIIGTGLKLWEYVGGPWKSYKEYRFESFI